MAAGLKPPYMSKAFLIDQRYGISQPLMEITPFGFMIFQSAAQHNDSYLGLK
jgi:hypothetical protein